jgi:hypothetical protein
MMRPRMMRPKTEPTTIPPIFPALSQGPAFASGCEVWVGTVVAVLADVPADVVLEMLSVVLEIGEDGSVVLSFVGGCSLLVHVSDVVDRTVGGGDKVSGLVDGTVIVGVGSEVMRAIDVTNWIDVTRGGGGGFASS